MGKRIAGTCYMKIDGVQVSIKGSIEVALSKTKRESLDSLSGPTGFFKETAITPYVKGAFHVPPDFPREKLMTSTDLTITTEFANGWVHTLSGGYNVGEPTFKGEEGETELQFDGVDGDFQ